MEKLNNLFIWEVSLTEPKVKRANPSTNKQWNIMMTLTLQDIEDNQLITTVCHIIFILMVDTTKSKKWTAWIYSFLSQKGNISNDTACDGWCVVWWIGKLAITVDYLLLLSICDHISINLFLLLLFLNWLCWCCYRSVIMVSSFFGNVFFGGVVFFLS